MLIEIHMLVLIENHLLSKRRIVARYCSLEARVLLDFYSDRLCPESLPNLDTHLFRPLAEVA